MKNIKKFKNFVNEELKPDTYKSAAEKLSKKGHDKRAKSLNDFAEKMTKKQLSDVGYIDIELGEKHFRLDDDNILINIDDKNELSLSIVFDIDMYKLIESDSEEKVWNGLSKEEKEEYVRQYSKWIPKHDSVDDLKASDIDIESLCEFIEMNYVLGVLIDFDKKKDYSFEVSGLVIDDRKIAFKLLKLLKGYASVKGGDIKTAIDKLTVNDLYEH